MFALDSESRAFYPAHRKPWAFNSDAVQTYEETKHSSAPVPINYFGEHRTPDLTVVPQHNED
jgi:hypothetical protein